MLSVILSRLRQVVAINDHPFGTASAWTLVGVDVIRLFGSLISQNGHDVEETRLSEAITACVDTSQAVSDRCLETQLEPSNYVGCETCSRDQECQWTGRLVLAPLLAQVIPCCVKCRQTTQLRAPPGAEVQWLWGLLPGDLYVVEYVGDRVALSRLLYGHGVMTCGLDWRRTTTCVLRISATRQRASTG